MLNKVVVQSPAKLNLHLKVHPKRIDGYHDIESVFQAIDFFDELSIETVASEEGCFVDTSSIKLPLENTLTVAHRVFCKYTSIKQGISVKLTKKVFTGAGLGGGSSNGASLINALDTMFNTKLSTEEKIALALQVGSDVPFFINGGAAIVTGRGEYIRQIKSRDDIYFVILMPNIHSSTKDAFALFDECYEDEHKTECMTLFEVEDVYRRSVVDWVFINSFTDLLVKQYPVIGRALMCLEENGAEYCQMSGSGAAVYGVFGNEEEAKRAYTKLSIGWSSIFARTYSVHH